MGRHGVGGVLFSSLVLGVALWAHKQQSGPLPPWGPTLVAAAVVAGISGRAFVPGFPGFVKRKLAGRSDPKKKDAAKDATEAKKPAKETAKEPVKAASAGAAKAGDPSGDGLKRRGRAASPGPVPPGPVARPLVAATGTGAP